MPLQMKYYIFLVHRFANGFSVNEQWKVTDAKVSCFAFKATWVYLHSSHGLVAFGDGLIPKKLLTVTVWRRVAQYFKG